VLRSILPIAFPERFGERKNSERKRLTKIKIEDVKGTLLDINSAFGLFSLAIIIIK